MSNPFAEMDCFVLAGGPRNPSEDFEPVGDTTRLERSYRRYASVFEKVRLVLKREQATERYLNYPHVCDDLTESSALIGLATALDRAESDAVFIGSAGLGDFPLDLVVDLVEQYNGELFLGYTAGECSTRRLPLFGVFNTRLLGHLNLDEMRAGDLMELLESKGRLMPLPSEVSASQIGLE